MRLRCQAPRSYFMGDGSGDDRDDYFIEHGNMPAPTARHILIVEDDGDLLEVLKLMLEEEGYRCSTAESGAEALSVAASQEVSLVLLDITMPDINGIEVARRMRANPRTEHVRLAIHTGLPAETIRQQFADYDAFIPKTEDAEKLIAAIKAACDQPMRTTSVPRASSIDRSGLDDQASRSMS